MSFTRFLLFSGIFQLCFLSSGLSQSTPKKALLALSKTDHTLAIVDPVSLKVLTRIPVGPDPHEVVASTDGGLAYVSNMGGGRLHQLDIIDLREQKALPYLDTGPMTGLHGLSYVGDKLWFTAEGAKSIGRFDPAKDSIDWIMGTGQDRTHMIYVRKDEQEIYTTNVESGTVSIFEHQQSGNGAPLRMEWEQTIIPVGKGSEGFDVSPRGNELWTVASETGTIAIIEITGKKLIDTIDAKIIGANRLKISPDGKLALISSLRTGDLHVYDVSTRKLMKVLHLGKGAAGILIDTDGSRAFVACSPDNYIAIIDLKTLDVKGRVDVGGGPDGLAWAIRR